MLICILHLLFKVLFILLFVHKISSLKFPQISKKLFQPSPKLTLVNLQQMLGFRYFLAVSRKKPIRLLIKKAFLHFNCAQIRLNLQKQTRRAGINEI